jgi:hypothetical protein
MAMWSNDSANGGLAMLITLLSLFWLIAGLILGWLFWG